MILYTAAQAPSTPRKPPQPPRRCVLPALALGKVALLTSVGCWLGRKSGMVVQGPLRKTGTRSSRVIGCKTKGKGRRPDIESARRITALWGTLHRKNHWMLSPATKFAVLLDQMIVPLAPRPRGVLQIKWPYSVFKTARSSSNLPIWV